MSLANLTCDREWARLWEKHPYARRRMLASTGLDAKRMARRGLRADLDSYFQSTAPQRIADLETQVKSLESVVAVLLHQLARTVRTQDRVLDILGRLEVLS